MSNLKYLKRGWLGKKTSINVSSRYGLRHGRMHRGIDLSVPVGTIVYAPFSGKVERYFQGSGRTGRGYGAWMTLTEGDIQLRFGHLSAYIASSGQYVQEGQPIARTGGVAGSWGSGDSTGKHLHFEVRYDHNHVFSNGTDINPKYLISDALYNKVTKRAVKDENIIIPKIGETPTKEQEKEIKKIQNYVSDSEIEDSAEEDVSADVDWGETESDDKEVSEKIKDGYASGIWQIVKLVLDSSVANLLVYDTTISSMTGTLIGFFNKACQRPLVEFSGDTFGSQYYFIIKKPPFDRKNMIHYLSNFNLLDNFKTKEYNDANDHYVNLLSDKRANDNKSKFYKTVLSSSFKKFEIIKNRYVIMTNDIINSSISFNTENIYSWYQLYVTYELGEPDMLKYITPAILFPEYAALWGSKSLVIQSQYVNFINAAVRDKIERGKESEYGNSEARSALEQLHYLIESNAYNPFVRKGTITITGNRKIKRGTFISVNLEGVMETFYVDAVSQNYSVENNSIVRTTTLSVSHGMVSDFIEPKGNKKISYFNIIDFGNYEKDKSSLNMGNWHNVIANWKVNKEVFNFFLHKLQFIIPQ